MNKVLVIGGVSYDTIIHMEEFPEPISKTYALDTLHETVGSTGSGKALTLNRLGMDVTFHGVIGDDIFGKMIETYFKNEQLNFIYDVTPKGTQRHVNLMDKSGGRISYMLNSTFDPQVNMERIDEQIVQCDHVIINIINYCRKAIPYAKKHHKTIWTDLHDYDGVNPYHEDFIEAADYITLSSDNLPDYRSFMESMIKRGKKLVVCTHGTKGATALTREGKWLDVPIMKNCQFVDTNGAGDSFFSGLMYGLLKGFDEEKSIKLGTIAAGLSVESKELFDTTLSEQKLINTFKSYYGENN